MTRRDLVFFALFMPACGQVDAERRETIATFTKISWNRDGADIVPVFYRKR